MLERTLLMLAVLALSPAVGAARDEAKKEACPTFDLDGIVALIDKAPTCLRALAVFEACEFGASGDVQLGAAVTKKCEADFLGRLAPAQKRVYDGRQRTCARKYRNEPGTMYRSFEAFCGAYVARDYSAKVLKRNSRK